jgi:hypothetical protein
MTKKLPAMGDNLGGGEVQKVLSLAEGYEVTLRFPNDYESVQSDKVEDSITPQEHAEENAKNAPVTADEKKAETEKPAPATKPVGTRSTNK